MMKRIIACGATGLAAFILILTAALAIATPGAAAKTPTIAPIAQNA
ncbi:MAG: hypothetical protein AAGC95_04170 [Pseudomonadota bacterium]